MKTYSVFKVLVVDDDADNLKSTMKMLQLLGIPLKSAANGEEAIKMAKNDFYDLILMDYRMPGLDGVETAERMRAFIARDHTRIIGISADNSQRVKKKCLDAGMKDFIAKPLTAESLLNTVKGHLDELESLHA